MSGDVEVELTGKGGTYVLTCTYDSMYRLATAAATTDTGKAMSVGYSYTNDLLASVTTPSTTYSFHYGSFGLASSMKIGTRTLASYSYTADRNFYLSALDYGNGDKVQYSYREKSGSTLARARLRCPISSLPINRLRQLSTAAHAYALLHLP